MKVIESIQSLRQQLAPLHQKNTRLGLVPTMGNLHQGHLDLVSCAKEQAQQVVVSIFVNPMQFEAGGDLDNYPRSLSADLEKLEQAGVDMVFTPAVDDIYGNDLSRSTQVVVPGISSLWCGASRQGHFEGVTTIVNKLFNLVQPDIAVFGEKDFQQLSIIRKMVNDLNIPVDILGVATRREADGLAMSSRNAYLNRKERDIAANLHDVVLKLKENVVSGNTQTFQEMTQQAIKTLDATGFKTDYLAICRQSDLEVAAVGDTELVILAAAYLGKARLIDNTVFTIAGR